MVIKVSFQSPRDSSDPISPTELIKFFEVDVLPEKPKIVRKLKEMGCQFDPLSVSIKIHPADAAMMRSNGILVSRLY